MSDYIFMLESHLSVDQNRVVAEVQSAAVAQGLSLFLTGGAMRDTLGGFQVRDLDFTVEGNPAKLVKALTAKHGVKLLAEDDHRRAYEFLFPGGVTAQIAMARTEKYSKTGGKPSVSPATIVEDLQQRDFSINAIALSLNKQSRGLMIDPTNGLSEIGRREIRTLHSFSFYDDPRRLLRLHRLAVRLGYSIEERTRNQHDNAVEAEVHLMVTGRALAEELKHIADEPNPGDLLQVLEKEKLLGLFLPALAGPKLNAPGFAKLDKAKRQLPPEIGSPDMNWGPFFHALTEKLSAKETQELIKRTELKKSEVDAWKNLPGRAKKLESALKSPKLKKASQIYEIAAAAPAADIFFLMYNSQVRLATDRLKNYFQKHIPLAQEITDAEVEAAGVARTSPKFAKVKAQMVADRVDGKTKKPPPPPPPPPPPNPPGQRGRRPAARI